MVAMSGETTKSDDDAASEEEETGTSTATLGVLEIVTAAVVETEIVIDVDKTGVIADEDVDSTGAMGAEVLTTPPELKRSITDI